MAEHSPTPPINRKLEAALHYASLGWLVLPLHNIESGSCSCGNSSCASPGKHPRLKSGLMDASRDPDQIQWWWSKWPNANVAIRTGRESGLVVIDIDPRNGGDLSFESIEDLIPDTVMQMTGGGGAHYLFSYPPLNQKVKSRSNILPGIDIKADGGYIVASPSDHQAGGVYEFEASSEPNAQFMPVQVPPAIVDMLDLYTAEENITLEEEANAIELDQDEINKIKSALSYIPPEDRDTWVQMGMALHNEGNTSQMFEIWDEWSQSTEAGNYSARSQITTWRSFKNKKRKITLDTLWQGASRRGWVYGPEANLTFLDDTAGDGSQEGDEEDKLELGYKADESIMEWGGMQSFGDLEEEEVDCREHWWRGTTLRAKSKTIVVGMPKAKKTFFVLGMGMAAASGSHFAGTSDEFKFPRPLKTFWFQGEMHKDDTKQRFQMMTRDMTSEQKALVRENFLFSAPLRWDLMNPKHFMRMEYEIAKHQPELIFFDPFSKFNQVNENDNAEMLEVLDRFDCLIRKYGVSIVLVHHTGKGAKSKIQNSGENPFDVMRGASSLLGWMEAGMIIGPGEDKESIKVIYEHRAQRVPDPHGMRLEFSEDGTKAEWKMLVEQLEDGSYAAIKDDSDEINADRVRTIVRKLKDKQSFMTSGAVTATISNLFKVGERTAKGVTKLVANHPQIKVVPDGRQSLYWHVEEWEKQQ